MRWNLQISRMWTPLSLLVMMSCLVACSQTNTTLTGVIDGALSGGTEQRAESSLDKIRADICRRAWRPTPYSSHDTPETQISNRANNASRTEFCRGAED